MKPLLAGPFLIVLLASASTLNATTLSVVPLVEALQNPALFSDDAAQPARDDVLKHLLNEPNSDAERDKFHNHLAGIAKHKDTRVGQLFFAALSATPDIENLPGTTTSADIIVVWPLALASQMRVHIEWRKSDGMWKVSKLRVTFEGVAAAPIEGLAPYFGEGEPSLEFLDFEPIDYLVGRDPADRVRPEAEQADFDFAKAVETLFATESDVYESLINDLNETVNASTPRPERIAAIEPHLATTEEVKALKAADADEDTRLEFWAGIYKQLKAAEDAPRPASLPKRANTEVHLSWHIEDEDNQQDGKLIVLRLPSGEIAPRGGALTGLNSEE